MEEALTPTDGAPESPRGLLIQGGKLSHPSVGARWAHGHAALGEEFRDVGVAEAIPEVPPHGEHDDIEREKGVALKAVKRRRHPYAGRLGRLSGHIRLVAPHRCHMPDTPHSLSTIPPLPNLPHTAEKSTPLHNPGELLHRLGKRGMLVAGRHSWATAARLGAASARHLCFVPLPP